VSHFKSAQKYFFSKAFSEKNVSDKSCLGRKGTEEGTTDLILGGVVKVKVTLNFLNGTPNFSVHILVAYLENFLKHYNFIFSLSTFRVIRIESYNTVAL